MSVQERLYSAEELWELSHQTDQRLELIKGLIHEMAPTGGLHGVITSELNYYLQDFINKQKVGLATGAETGFVLASDPFTVRAPDIAFIARERVPDPIPSKYFSLAPDLAVEVVLPSDTALYIREKVIDFLRAGTRLVWIVYPDSRTVDVYRPDQATQVVDIHGTLDGGDVLPGFDVYANVK